MEEKNIKREVKKIISRTTLVFGEGKLCATNCAKGDKMCDGKGKSKGNE